MSMIPEPEAEGWRIRLLGKRLTIDPLGLRVEMGTGLAAMSKAYLTVAAWEKNQRLVACFSHGEEGLWWGAQRNQFILKLSEALVLVESLAAALPKLPGPPKQILIQAAVPEAIAIANAMAILFPEARLRLARTATRRERVTRKITRMGSALVAHLRKKAGQRRLARLGPRGPRPRVLLFQSEIQWVDGRDKDLWSAADALRQRGAEVITVVLPSRNLGKNLAGFCRRPRDHIFAEIIPAPRRRFVPQAAAPIGRNQFKHGEFDCGSFVARWMVQAAPRWEVADRDCQWADFIRRLSPDFILMAHEHYDWGTVPRAAKLAQIRMGVVQHGRITESHPLYIFPPAAGNVFPFPWRIFVYGHAEAEILTQASVYKKETIVIAGSPEWDAFRKRAEVSPPAARTGGAPARRLPRLLFTSQPGLHLDLARMLLDGVAALAEGARLRIRLHPREEGSSVWTSAATRAHRVEFEVGRKCPLEEDLAWCDLHVTYTSSCLLHAIMAGKPSILIGTREDPWREQFVTAQLAVKIDEAGGFAQAVQHWRSPPAMSHFMSQREQFLHASGAGLESAGERIAQELMSAL